MSTIPDRLSFDNVKHFVLTWTPRAIAASVFGYYSLGVAYEIGLMAAIDQLAIPILKFLGGYVGIGTFMPTFQWYSASAVQIIAAVLGGILYTQAAKIVVCCFHLCFGLVLSHERQTTYN